MTTASRFNISLLEGAQRVPGKPRHKTREVKVGRGVSAKAARRLREEGAAALAAVPESVATNQLN